MTFVRLYMNLDYIFVSNMCNMCTILYEASKEWGFITTE